MKVCVSIFSDPHMEISFGLISDIISNWSNFMNIDTYIVVMSICYSLQSKTSSDLYQRPEMHYIISLTKKAEETAREKEKYRQSWS